MQGFCRIAFVMLSWIGAGCRHAGSTAAIPPVEPFSLLHYLGRWHEAARMPQWFERGMTEVTADYELAADGSVAVCNRGMRDGKPRSIRGRARWKRDNAGELEVSFFRPFYGTYRIAALKEDYSAALVVGAKKDCAWILVRDPAMAETVLPEYVALLKQWGFNVEQLEFPAMAPSEKAAHR